MKRVFGYLKRKLHIFHDYEIIHISKGQYAHLTELYLKCKICSKLKFEEIQGGKWCYLDVNKIFGKIEQSNKEP